MRSGIHEDPDDPKHAEVGGEVGGDLPLGGLICQLSHQEGEGRSWGSQKGLDEWGAAPPKSLPWEVEAGVKVIFT